MYGDPDWRGPEPGTLHYGRVSNWLNRRAGPRVLERLRALYAAEVTMTDRWIGVLLERLHELRLERETIIVLVSDHGIFLGSAAGPARSRSRSTWSSPTSRWWWCIPNGAGRAGPRPTVPPLTTSGARCSR